MGVKDTANLAMIPAAYAEDKVYSVLPSDGDGDFTFTRSGSGTRINKGGYIETMGNNVPRLNYRLDADGNPTGCAELLLEESRQNLFQRSEEFDNSYWTKARSSITANQVVAPDGTNTADKFFDSTDNNSHILYRSMSVSTSSVYTFSCFLKKGILDKAFLAFDSTTSQSVVFNLENGSVESQGASVTSSSIEKFPNDWFRCSLTHTPTTTTRLYRIGTYNGGITYAGTGTDFVYLWGAQLELGSTISSYIPTTSSAITRNKDSAYNQPFGDLASDYPITVFWKGQITNYNAGTFAFSIYDNGSNARYLGLAWNSTSNFYLYRRSTNNDADLVSYTTQIGDVKKIAIKFTSNTTAKVYIDGIEIYNLSSGLDVDWDFDSVLVGQQSVISDGGKRIPADELFVWNKALTDAEMVDVTSYDTFAEMATGQQFTIQ
jgi:hypothetical protein